MATEAHLNAGSAGTAGTATVVGERGRRLHVRVWGPAGADRAELAGEACELGERSSPVVASVAVVHGFGEHSGRYEALASALARSGWAVWAADLRGHGLSEGPRADIEKFEWVLADLDQLVRRVLEASLGAPVVLLGHSMGGALAAAYATLCPGRLAGLVLSAPAVHLAFSGRGAALAVRALARLLPRAGVAKIAPAALSHDTEAVGRFVSDPLVWHGRVPARTAVQMYRAACVAVGGAGSVRLPVLVVHGSEDRIVPVGSSRRLFAQLGSPDKALSVFEGFRHETLQEVGRDNVVAGLLGWLGQRWGAREGRAARSPAAEA